MSVSDLVMSGAICVVGCVGAGVASTYLRRCFDGANDKEHGDAEPKVAVRRATRRR